MMRNAMTTFDDDDDDDGGRPTKVGRGGSVGSSLKCVRLSLLEDFYQQGTPARVLDVTCNLSSLDNT